jgi:hypothetical protein
MRKYAAAAAAAREESASCKQLLSSHLHAYLVHAMQCRAWLTPFEVKEKVTMSGMKQRDTGNMCSALAGALLLQLLHVMLPCTASPAQPKQNKTSCDTLGYSQLLYMP